MSYFTYYFNRILFLAITLSLISCNNNDSKKEVVISETSATVENFILQWNASHKDENLEQLLDLYAVNVNYYGTEYNRSEVLKDKKKLFEKYPNFNQTAEKETFVISEEEDKTKVHFDKAVVINGKKKIYPSYIILERENNSFKIITEGDEVTDASVDKSISSQNENYKAENQKVKGNFKGDGNDIMASLEYPEMIKFKDIEENGDERIDWGGYECVGGCNTVIRFSNPEIAPITIKGATPVMLSNPGDLNNDGADNLVVQVWGKKYNAYYLYNVQKRAVIVPPQYVNIDIHDTLMAEDIFKKVDDHTIQITQSSTGENLYALDVQNIDLRKIDISEFKDDWNIQYNY